jgi:sulfate permease, SulP family
MSKSPGEFGPLMATIFKSFGSLSVTTTLLALFALALILLTVKYVKRVPGYIVAMVVGTAVVAALKLPVETIGSRFGGVPQGLPHFALPHLNISKIPELMPSALTVAMLGAIESLLSAVVGDRMSRDRHNPNVELIVQGIANLASPLVGGLPATGAIARTATSIRSGAQTPVAGMLHALTLLAIVLFAAPLARFVPLAVLASILFVVAYNMGEWREIPHILKMSKADITVWIVTFGLTVFADLTVAVEVGMILAALLYIRKVTLTTTVSEVTPEDIDDGRLHVLQDKAIPDYAAVFRIHGPFLFGATDKISEIMDRLQELPPIVILRLRNMTAIDSTGLQALEDLAHQLASAHRTLLLCGARDQPRKLMEQTQFEEHIGNGNLCPHIQAALARAEAVYLNEYADTL